MRWSVQFRGFSLFLIAAFSAGRPKLSKPIGYNTLKPCMRRNRARTSPMAVPLAAAAAMPVAAVLWHQRRRRVVKLKSGSRSWRNLPRRLMQPWREPIRKTCLHWRTMKGTSQLLTTEPIRFSQRFRRRGLIPHSSPPNHQAVGVRNRRQHVPTAKSHFQKVLSR